MAMVALVKSDGTLEIILQPPLPLPQDLQLTGLELLVKPILYEFVLKILILNIWYCLCYWKKSIRVLFFLKRHMLLNRGKVINKCILHKQEFVKCSKYLNSLDQSRHEKFQWPYFCLVFLYHYTNNPTTMSLEGFFFFIYLMLN